MSEQRLNVPVDNGKYTAIMEANGRLHALRHGEPWQDLSGNKLVYSLAAELEDARKRLAEVHSWIVCACIATPEDMMQSAPRMTAVTDISQPYEEPTNG